MNILAIGAHPDDIEYGCGGTLLKYSKKGENIYLLVMTKGESGGEPAIREKEQEKAAKILKATKIFWGGFEDTKLLVEKPVISFIDKVICEVNPDEAYVNYFDDTHQDHRALAQAVMASTRYVKRVFFYEDYTSSNFEPDIFVDIADVLEEKVKLLGAHQSQVNKSYPTGLDTIESIRAIANYRGFQGKVKYAEGFKAFRYLRGI